MILENEFTNDPRVKREAESLAKFGHKVSVLALNYGNTKANENDKGVNVVRFNTNHFFIDKFRPLTPNFPLYNLLWKKHIINFIKKNQIDVLHIHNLPLMKLGIKIAKKLNILTVGDFHENYCEAIKMYYWANTLKGKLLISFRKWDLFQDYTVRNLNKIIVTANEAIEMFNKKYDRCKSDIFAVDNSIDIKQFTSSKANAKLDIELRDKYKDFVVFGYSGGILPNRGLQHLIKILPKFRNWKFRIVIIGRGQFKKGLVNFAINNKIEHLIDWYDWQPFENLQTFTKHFDVGITRLERNLQNDYTTPNKVFQYMYMEKPVLTADSLPMRRIVDKTKAGLVFKSKDDNDLAEKFIRLYENPELRKQLGENGKKAVMGKYNWKNTSKNLIKLYKEIETSINQRA